MSEPNSQSENNNLDNHDQFEEPLYERGFLKPPDAEDREDYRPGGLHPVHIGDKFGTDNRYRVIQKLGRGGLATVWLCRDEDKQQYVALKIILADASDEDSPELCLSVKRLEL